MAANEHSHVRAKLSSHGLITPILERVFSFLHAVSLPYLLLRYGPLARYRQGLPPKQGHAFESVVVEACVLLWVGVEAAILLLLPYGQARGLWIAGGFLAGIRAADIVQVSVNTYVFDHIRVRRSRIIKSAVRTLLLNFVNYLELICCFAIIYSALPTGLPNATGIGDTIYFSAISQLTVGYGDIAPHGGARIVAVVQGIIGLIFTVFVLGRIVSLLPKVAESSDHGAGRGDEPHQ